MFTHKYYKVHMACKNKLYVKSKGVLKVTGSHVHFRSSSISEMVVDRDVVTTGH